MRRCHCLLPFVPLCLILLSSPALATTTITAPPPARTATMSMSGRLTPSAMWLGRLQTQSALTATQQTTTTPPGKFPFQTLTAPDGLIVLHYYQQPTAFGAQVMAATRQFLLHPVRDTLGFTLKHAVNIFIYNSRADFLQGAAVTNPEEVGAYTLPEQNEIFLPIDTVSDVGQFLPHELTHVVFHQNEDSGQLESAFFRFFPLWLDEGLAAYDEDATDVRDYTYALDQAVSSHTIVDFLQSFINVYPTNATTNYLCYAEARAFIAFLVSTYGAGKLHQFVAQASDDDLQLDAETIFGLNLQQLQSQWEVSLGLPPTMKAQGYLPTLTPPNPFQQGKLNAIADRAQPLALPVNAIPETWLMLVLLLVGGALILLIVEWRSQQPQAAPSLAMEPYPYPSPLLAPDIDLAGDAPSAPPNEQIGMALPARDVAVPSTPPIVNQQPLRWYDGLLILAPAPLALLAGVLRAGLDPFHSYYAAYIAAAVVSLPLLVVALWLNVRDFRARRLRFTHLASVILSLFLLVSTWMLAPSLGEQQAQAYETGGAYTLALHYFNAMHAPTGDSARVQSEWGNEAISVHDYSAATTHLRAAITLVPTTMLSNKDRSQLVAVIEAWNQALIAARQFAPALQVLTDQAQSATCDAPCHTRMTAALDATSLAWGNELLDNSDLAGASTHFQQALHYAPTDAQASNALVETQATQALQQALASGASGDASAMNTQLRAIVATYPTTGAAHEATTTPEPVTGVISDGSGAAVTNDRLIMLAFTTATAARSFTFDFNKDTTAFKIATTIGAGGKFTMPLPPGYWYVPLWDDPSQASNYGVNSPQASDHAAFTVQSLTPLTVGTITGF